LDGVQEDGEGEALGGGGWTVGGCGYAFLKEGPGETGEVSIDTELGHGKCAHNEA